MRGDDYDGRDDDLGASTTAGRDRDISSPSGRPQADDLNAGMRDQSGVPGSTTGGADS